MSSTTTVKTEPVDTRVYPPQPRMTLRSDASMYAKHVVNKAYADANDLQKIYESHPTASHFVAAGHLDNMRFVVHELYELFDIANDFRKQAKVQLLAYKHKFFRQGKKLENSLQRIEQLEREVAALRQMIPPPAGNLRKRRRLA